MSPQENDHNEPKLLDVAKHAKVSIMTASNVLRNVGRFSEKTRLKVISAAQEINYRPDPELSRLMARIRRPAAQRSRQTIGFVGTWSPDHDEHVNGYFQNIFNGALSRAEMRGYNIDRFVVDKRLDISLLHRSLYNRGIESLFITPWAYPGAHLRFPWEEFFVASASHALWKPSFNRATPHHHNNMLIALQNIRKLGYRRPLLVLPRTHDRVSLHAWWAAYLWYIRSHSQMEEIPVLCEKMNSIRTFGNALSKHQPDVVIATLPTVCEWLRRLGRRVPQDIGFVWVGGDGQDPELTQIDQRPRMVGEAAIDMLISQIQSNEKGPPECPHITMVEGVFQKGNTVCVQGSRLK